MPKITMQVTDYELKLIRRIARHEHRNEGTAARALMRMSLEMVRIEERTGWHYGPAPKLPNLPSPMPSRSRFHGWTKADRDTWILHGTMPARA